MKRGLQSSALDPQQAERDLHVTAGGHQGHHERVSPWLTSQEACDYLRYVGKARLISLYRFLKQNGIPKAWCNGRLRIARADLDRALTARRVS